jgi:hypothetical protein
MGPDPDEEESDSSTDSEEMSDTSEGEWLGQQVGDYRIKNENMTNVNVTQLLLF